MDETTDVVVDDHAHDAFVCGTMDGRMRKRFIGKSNNSNDDNSNTDKDRTSIGLTMNTTIKMQQRSTTRRIILNTLFLVGTVGLLASSSTAPPIIPVADAARHNAVTGVVQQPSRRRSAQSSTTAVSTNSLSITQRLVAGGVSRGIAQMTLYPVDALRTLAQTRDGRTLADVGVSALVRGCTTTSAFALFMGSIQFALFGVFRDRVGPLVASAIGAAGSCIVSVPQEVIKQRLVTGVYKGFGEACATIYKTEGILGFYSAWKPTMGRNVPFVMTTFTTMDLMKRYVLARTNKDKKDNLKTELTAVQNTVVGISSALVAGLLTQPVDVVKTRMMTQAASNAAPYSSAVNCFVTIVRTEGPMTLFSGLKQRSVYMGLLWGMTFALNGRFQKQMMTMKQTE